MAANEYNGPSGGDTFGSQRSREGMFEGSEGHELDGLDNSREDRGNHTQKSFASPKLSLYIGSTEDSQKSQPESRRRPSDLDSLIASTPTSTRNPSLRSPISPRNRDRGLSLRRSLLARSIRHGPERHESVIELQPARPLSSPPRHPDSDQTGKKSGANITVFPVSEKRYDTDADAKSVKKVHALSSLPHYETWIASRIAQNGLLSRMRVVKEKLRKKILRIHDKPPSKNGRHVDFDFSRKKQLIDDRTGHEYINNTILSTRYTLYNFVPRQLFAQFSKLANFYFLCVSILQMIPGLSTTGTYTTIVPLLFFVTISIAKEGYDDLRRYRLDKAENNRVSSVLRADESTVTETYDDNHRSDLVEIGVGQWAETKWHDIRVGDVVKLCRDEAVPADIVVLQATGTEEVAFIETMALDGETNLKSKQACPLLAKQSRNSGGLYNCGPQFAVEDPNLNLYSFEGRLSIGEKVSPLTNNDIIYRGSIIRNTAKVVGLVMYTGEECKIRMNATKNPRIKAVCIRPKDSLS